MKNIKYKKMLSSILIILLYLFLTVLFSSIHIIVNSKNLIINSLLLIIESLLVALIIIFILRDKLKGQFKKFKSNAKKIVKTSFKYWVVGFSLMYITNLLIYLFILKGIAPNEEANRIVINSYPLYSIVSMCLIAPIVEELIFRLNFKDNFKTKNGFILFTGLLFGLMHVILSLTKPLDLIYLIPYSILGITFSACFYRCKTIYSSILIHIFHNSLSIMIIMLNL